MNKKIIIALCFPLAFSFICTAQHSQVFQITNETNKNIKYLEATFVFRGRFAKKTKEIAERNRIEGTLGEKRINPGQTIVLNPYQATKVGVVHPVASYFKEPTIYLRRIVTYAPRAHRKFANAISKYGTRSKRDLVIYANKYDKLFITSRANYDYMMGIKQQYPTDQAD